MPEGKENAERWKGEKEALGKGEPSRVDDLGGKLLERGEGKSAQRNFGGGDMGTFKRANSGTL